MVFKNLVLFLSLWTLSSCFFFNNKEKPILQINSQKWTSSEFAKLLAHKISILNVKDIKNKTLIKYLKSELIKELFIKNLIIRWAKVHSIQVSEKKISLLEKNFRDDYPNDLIFELYLKKHIDKKQWRKTLHYILLNKKVRKQINLEASPPTLKVLKQYYKNHPRLFQKKSQIFIHHVFSERKEVLVKLYKAIKQNKNFVSLAEKFITDSSKIETSKWVKKGTLKVFDRAFALKKGSISPIWNTPYGYHIIQVLNKKSAYLIPFKKVQSKIKKELLKHRQKALFLKWLDTESKNTLFLKNEEALKKIKVKLL